ncbi:YqgE/AlgH family protein [Puniceicoccaceae bacterium K14]|nr:YqgE/AlgH family protein [Puniceicoccaceae bacterium K14]
MFDDSKSDFPDMAGLLLLAHPHLKDPNFLHSVILMTTHEENGSLGVVLNKNSGMRLSEVNTEFVDYGLGEVPLYNGGPVGTDQIILAGWELLIETNRFRLSFGMDPKIAQQKMLETPSINMRAFRGYAGWEAGQLAGELESNTWVQSQMNGQAITDMEGESLWRHLMLDIDPDLALLAFAPEKDGEN